MFKEVEPGGRRVLALVKLWRMPKEDLEDPVRQVWEETVRRILDGRADQLPKMSESPICHVRPRGRDSRDTLPTPRNGELVKRCFWLGNAYVAVALNDSPDSGRR